METERIALSQRERDWLNVLHEVKQKHMTQVEAAQRLKVTDRHVRRMLIRLGERGECSAPQDVRSVATSLPELGIAWIAAHSPQAKGRIERLFETLQDRLVKEMRLAGIDTLEAANRFLELRFIPEWEQRFTVAPRQPRNAHRRLGPEHRLEEILSMRAARKVAQDHTVSWEGNRWGYATGRRPRRSSGSARGDRAAPGWLALVAISRPLSPSATRPRTVAAHGVSKPQKGGFLPITHGGHFNMAENRTFLLCVDTNGIWRWQSPLERGHFKRCLTPS